MSVLFRSRVADDIGRLHLRERGLARVPPGLDVSRRPQAWLATEPTWRTGVH
jgi:hypothetical protein